MFSRKTDRESGKWRDEADLIADICFVDIPWLGIINLERLIIAVLVGMMKKITMEREDIIHQAQRKFLHVSPRSFSRTQIPSMQADSQRNYFSTVS